jgi:hypothetical protein
MKKSCCRLLVTAVLVVALMLPCARPACAFGAGGIPPATATAITYWTAATIGIGVLSYLAWVNRPANQPVDWSPRGPGGWYAGLYTGVSFFPSSDWHYKTPDRTFNIPTPYPTTALNVGFSNPSPVFGAKVGYYFHKFPYLGLEGDFYWSRPTTYSQTVKLSTPFPSNNVIPGNRARFPGQLINQTTLALHLMGRLGFIKDDEVSFGRIQPYVGIGPGITDLFGNADAAKNFGIDALVGVRYMIRKNLSVFAEFKINHQFAVELEHSKLKNLPSGPFVQQATASFDLTMQTIAVGMCVHFW